MSAGWNILDTAVVVSSLLALNETFINLNVARMLRAMRIIRLFGRINSLRKVGCHVPRLEYALPYCIILIY